MLPLNSFIKSWSVLSKTSDQPQVASHEGVMYVFVQGWPMTYKTFIGLMLKGIFGGTFRLTVAEWRPIHEEITQLTEGLSLEIPNKERSGFAVIQMIRNHLRIDNTSLPQKSIMDWVQGIEAKVAEIQSSTTSTTSPAAPVSSATA